MRIPSFPRQTSADSTVEDRPTTTTTQRDDRLPHRSPVAPRTSTVTPPRDETTTTIPATRTEPTPTEPVRTEPTRTVPAARTESERAAAVTEERPPAGRATVDPQPVPDRKPRASLMATAGLILGVAGALLVLSGPLMGYGIGVAALGLLLSLGGLLATRKRHVAGKTDALIGMLLSLGAIVVGVLALTGSLSWLGTDMQPVNSLREWLDAQFVNRI